MSKLGCKCGYVIVDQTDSLPYKARLLRDEAEEAYWREFERQIKTFVAAVEAGDKACYVAEYGTHSPWIKSSDLLINRLSSIQAHHETTIYECKGCGRLWLQKPDSKQFVSYTSEENEYRAILAAASGMVIRLIEKP